MAARLVVALALVAVCHSIPVQHAAEEFRDGRSLTIANGFASGYHGENKATANANGGASYATSSNSGNAGLARDGQYQYYPGQAIATAQRYDDVNDAAVDIARTQALNSGAYYHPVPVAAPAVVTYNQNFAPAELVYQPAPASAESVAMNDGNTASSLSTATSNGGSAESDAQTRGGAGQWGVTATNAKTNSGLNTAVSNANTVGQGIASSNAKTAGSGYGQASSKAQSNGYGYATIPSGQYVEPAIIAAKYQGYNAAPVGHGSASSNAQVNGQTGSSISSAKAANSRSIHWHFGTAYDIPAGYGAIKSVAPVVYNHAPVVYQAAIPESPYYGGVAKSVASSRKSGSADSQANLNPGFASVKSTANSQQDGSAMANADINTNNAYGRYRSVPSYGAGVARVDANTNGRANAGSNAQLSPNGHGFAKSTANSNGGSANANSNINNRYYGGLYRSGAEGSQWGRTVTNARSEGVSAAESKAQDYFNGQRIADASAKSTLGSAYADSTIL